MEEIGVLAVTLFFALICIFIGFITTENSFRAACTEDGYYTSSGNTLIVCSVEKNTKLVPQLVVE